MEAATSLAEPEENHVVRTDWLGVVRYTSEGLAALSYPVVNWAVILVANWRASSRLAAH